MRRALIDLTPLRSSRPFRRLMIGRTCSGVGGQLTLVAVMFQIWRSTGSPAWTGAVGLAQAVPLIVLGLFAGSVIDRHDRRRVYLAATTGAAACSLLLAVQGLWHQLPAIGVLALVALQGCFGAAAGPAARTFVPRLLPAEQVAAGLAVQRISFQGALFVGPALAGLVIGWGGVGVCYLLDALTFGCSWIGAAGLPAMRPSAATTASSRPSTLSDIAVGLRFLLGHAAVRGALVTDLAATVLSFPISLFPVINAERFDDDPRTLGLFLTAIGVGGLVASVLSGSFTRFARPGLVMIAGAAAWGVAIAAFGVIPNPWIGLGCLVLAGAADTASVVARGTIVQLHTPDHLRGRVAAAEQIVGQAGPDLGSVRGGLVAGLTSGPFALASGGLLCLAAVAILAVRTPGLRVPLVELGLSPTEA
jgi:MFS family permease